MASLSTVRSTSECAGTRRKAGGGASNGDATRFRAEPCGSGNSRNGAGRSARFATEKRVSLPDLVESSETSSFARNSERCPRVGRKREVERDSARNRCGSDQLDVRNTDTVNEPS